MKNTLSYPLNLVLKLKYENTVSCTVRGCLPGGMVVFNADCYDQAILIAESEPFIHSGCKTYELRSLEVANKDNHFLF